MTLLQSHLTCVLVGHHNGVHYLAIGCKSLTQLWCFHLPRQRANKDFNRVVTLQWTGLLLLRVSLLVVLLRTLLGHVVWLGPCVAVWGGRIVSTALLLPVMQLLLLLGCRLVLRVVCKARTYNRHLTGCRHTGRLGPRPTTADVPSVHSLSL